MSRAAAMFYRRSLTLAFVAFVFGFVALARVFGFADLAEPPSPEYLHSSILICVIAAIVCILVLTNLVADVGRGYSPSRCSLAAVIVLAALVGPIVLAVRLIAH